MNGSYQTDLKCLVKNAIELAESTDRLRGELNRLDEFEEESRSEMYTILQALHRETTADADTLQHMLAGSPAEVDCV